MKNKKIYFNEDGRNKLLKGIKKMAGAVKSTLGPSGNTVLIESEEHLRGITVTKDGVTVAKSIALKDPVEDLAVRIMREASERTATQAGDGTTTAVVIAEALVEQGTKGLDAQAEYVNRTEVLRWMVELTKEAVGIIKKTSKKVTKKTLRDVAIISANNDKEIGGLIADAFMEVGESGIVTVELSQGSETTYSATNGIKVDRGYTSPLFVNNRKKDECIFEDVYILVSDAEITNILQIETILKPIIQEQKKLLIIAPCSGNVTNTLAANVMKNGLKICNIQPPSFGYKQHELMEDIALSVGATYFSEKTGDDLSLISFNDLGVASKIIVGRDNTIIIKEDIEDNAQVTERVAQLREALAETNNVAERRHIENRIASLCGGIGVISVGGATDLEQKELYDRVDDAVCAVKSAMEEGILAGGGLVLYRIAKLFMEKWQQFEPDYKNRIDEVDKHLAYAILADGMKMPMFQIHENAGTFDKIFKAPSPFEDEKEWYTHGMNAKSGEYGDLIKMGVIDPAKVTRCALENAVSVAVTILSTNAIVTVDESNR
jgi:chaperonin GroEL